ncbi:MAG TPA: alpha-N-arabinofuranosidase [Opitutus sp.]|nr:alpha-N-arabinofuranosidase [Opitutus sp.]
MKTLLLSAISLGLAAPIASASSGSATAVLHADQPGAVINRNLYGQFTEHLGHCIYGGIWVEPNSPIPNTRGIRNDVVAALREIRVPVVRWPGGCFAEEYHWRDGIGAPDQRPSMINTNWGGVVENNHFGTAEFMDFCEQVGCEPYICANLGSGTVQEASNWIEYMTSDANSPLANLRRANGRDKPWHLKYVAFGNENWGCGGTMRPEYYSDVYNRFNSFAKDYPGNKLYRVACGPNGDDYHWTEVLMRNIHAMYQPETPGMDGIALHNYTIPVGHWTNTDKGSATNFGEDQYALTLAGAGHMDELVSKHLAIMDRYDSKKKVALVVDEWGVWTDSEPGTNPGFLYQQNSLRDALLAALTLHVFQKHADRVSMANIAQMVNVLQSMILTDGPRLLLTPTYYVYDLFKVHQDATSLPIEVTSPDYAYGQTSFPAVSASASRDAAGKIHISLVNANPHDSIALSCKLDGLASRSVSGRILTAPAMNSINTFDAPHTVEPAAFNGATVSGDTLNLTLPAKSVVVLEL